MELRDYQREMFEGVRDKLIEGHKSVLMQAPTGSGKTLVASAIVQSALEKNSRVAVVAPRRELVYQASSTLESAGVGHGIVMAGESRHWSHNAFVACVPTLHARCVRRGQPPPKVDLCIVDEAHLSLAPSVIDVLKLWPNARIVGMTATPARSDGRALGQLYEVMVKGPSVQRLTDAGFLVPARYFSASPWDLTKVRMSGGDYAAGDLSNRVNTPKLVGDVVDNWMRICPDRQTVVFAASVAHSMALCEQFRAAGFNAEHIDGRMDNEERKGILDRFQMGATQILLNCQICTYGWDAPAASCCVLARPTKSRVAYLQMVGRVLRTHESKQDCIVIDHGGVVESLGFACDDRRWSLDGNDTQGEVLAPKKSEDEEEKVFTCGECNATFKAATHCPECGAEVTRKTRKVLTTDAELREIDRKTRKAQQVQLAPIDWMAQFKGFAHLKGKHPNWAIRAYKTKFKKDPDIVVLYTPRQTPTDEVVRYAKYLQIRAAKSRYRSAA